MRGRLFIFDWRAIRQLSPTDLQKYLKYCLGSSIQVPRVTKPTIFDSYLLNPMPLLRLKKPSIDFRDYMYLAAQRNYFDYKTTGDASLLLDIALCDWAELTISRNRLENNGLITITENDKIKLRYEEIN